MKTFLLVIVISLISRCTFLSKYPPGIHGDEGLTGLRALYIWNYGFIGFFDNQHAYGQWALAEYLTVPFVLLIDDDFYSIRLPMAICGSISLILFYLFVKELTRSPIIAFLGFLYQAVFFNHFHLSRIAITPILSECFMIGGLYSYFKGAYGVSGVLFGLASISYATGLLLPLCLFASLWLFRKNLPPKAVTTWLIITLTIHIYEIWSGRLSGRASSVFYIDDLDTKLEIVTRHLSSLFLSGYFDSSDGLGLKPIYSVGEFVLLLFALMAVTKDKKLIPIFFATSAGVLILVCYTTLSTEFGFQRRILPALTLINITIFYGLSCWNYKILRLLLLTIAGFCLIVGVNKLKNNINSEPIAWVFTKELTQIRNWVKRYQDAFQTLGFQSGRWSIHYETNRWFYRKFSHSKEFHDIKKVVAKEFDISVFDDRSLRKFFRRDHYKCSKLNKHFYFCMKKSIGID
ncbi:MAG: hypothetical protein NZT61_04995 [Deltaproteobacteria bacterium]|nr:hypothetical protein [Deltaproteobacteria bacterium]MCX7953062.1 hypothetical protein [Deltaproteobacteria bacterium]